VSNMTKTIAFAAAISAFLMVQAMGGFAQETGSPTPNTAPPLRIGSGDLLEISVFDSPELSGRFRVDEKGDISAPLIGPVRVEGKTAVEAGEAVQQHYVDADILKPTKAHATVFISEYATQGILVTGEVKSGGLFPALGVRMFNDVMIAAGGVTATASSKVVITRKSDPDHPITVEYNPEALAPVVPKIQIFPGDTITVPRAGIVYVLGNVGHSGGFVLDGRKALTVETAMALSGGGGHGAAMNDVHLIRTYDGGRKEDIHLEVKRILLGKAPDVELKDGDILYVPTSNVKLFTEQAINSAIGIGTSVAIYRTAY
jgi:polysaccharide export outer membrane protein